MRPTEEVRRALQASGLVSSLEGVRFEALTGGVSSEIWRVDLGERVVCVKRALAKLRVEADWQAPVERSRYELAWYELANDIMAGVAPRVFPGDDDARVIVMEYLDAGSHKLWKDELRAGRANPSDAAQIGRRIARVHAGTAGVDTVSQRFPPNDIFRAIRLEPYLGAVAEIHVDLRDTLLALSHRTANTRLAMVHGDVSPKNILIGPHGPVFLDAECACIGDPAFDLAFCLNHLLLKCLWVPQAQADLFDCFGAMCQAYLEGVEWEAPDAVEVRAASLLPGLLLARVDGKSPVEYVDTQRDRDRVRRCARRLLLSPPLRLTDVLAEWQSELLA